jgi:putative peptidoglycan lipid II flippase
MSRLMRTGGATLLAASSAQLVLLVAMQIASTEGGAVAALYYADRIFQLPLGFVGVAMGTVVLSEMASHESARDDAMLGRALALGLALAVPAAVALAALAEPIVSVLFEHGRFGPEDRVRTAGALAAFALGLPFAVMAKVFGQVYFVRRMPRIPLLAGLAAVLVAVFSGYGAAPGKDAATVAALAASLAFVAQAVLLSLHLRRQGLWRPSLASLRPIIAILGASAIMLGALLLLLPALTTSLAPGEPLLLRIASLAAHIQGGLSGAFGLPHLRLARASARTPRS